MINKILSLEFNRFILTGLLNTVLIYITYLVGLSFFPYLVSYTISLGFGVVFSYYMNSSFVFRADIKWGRATFFLIFYIFQYLLAIILLYILVDILNIYESIAPFIVIGLIFPITFLGNKYIVRV